MSLDEYKGAAYAVRTWMREAQAEIDAGTRKGAAVKWKRANPAKTVIGWFERRVLRGEFRRRA